MTTPEDRAAALADLARKWLENRPDLAERVLREMPVESEELPALVEAYLANVMAHDADDALRWVDSLEDPALHDLARQRLVALLPDEQLADTASAFLHPGRLAAHGFDATSEQFLHRWSGQDPDAAAAWLGRMPVGVSQDAGLRSVAGHLIHTGPQSSAAWLDALPTESLRSSARDVMSAALAAYPEPLREGLLGPPDSPLRATLAQDLARLLPPPEDPLPDDTDLPGGD